MKRGHGLALASLFLIVNSCALLQKPRREATASYDPNYRGSVVPVVAPVTIRYGSLRNSFKVWTLETAELAESDICRLFLIGQALERLACMAQVRRHGDRIEIVREERILAGTMEVVGPGEDLEWNIKSLAVTVDGQEWRPRLPINQIRVLSDAHGRPRNIEVSFPALEDSGAEDIPKPGAEDYRRMVNLFQQSLLPLPERPVKTGDVLFSLPVEEMIAEMLAFWGEQDKDKLLGVIEANKHRLNYRIKGWSQVNDTRVVLADLDFTGTVKIQDEPMQVKNTGYIVLDASTGHLIRRVHLSQMNYGKSQFKVVYKFIAKEGRH